MLAYLSCQAFVIMLKMKSDKMASVSMKGFNFKCVKYIDLNTELSCLRYCLTHIYITVNENNFGTPGETNLHTIFCNCFE